MNLAERMRKEAIKTPHFTAQPDEIKYWVSKGYLQGYSDMEAKVGELVEALEWADSLIKKLGIQFGCDGKHRGPGWSDCPKELHHHHDDKCVNKVREALAPFKSKEKDGGK